MMKLIDTCNISTGFRITIKKKVRSKMKKLELGDIIGFYETRDGILLKKIG